MTERFYDIKHLTTGQLRELFSSYRKQGWIDFEYWRKMRRTIKPNIMVVKL